MYLHEESVLNLQMFQKKLVLQSQAFTLHAACASLGSELDVPERWHLLEHREF